MKPLFIIGAGKFAYELADYAENSSGPDGARYRVAGFLASEGESRTTPEEMSSSLDFGALQSYEADFALGISDMDARAALIETIPAALHKKFPCLVHASASLARSANLGAGVVVGPMSRVGANARIGAFSVLNYLCAVPHHSVIGANTFLTPGFQCGNSAEIGADCFFGINSSVGPGVRVGNGVRTQVGVCLLEDVGDGMSVFSSNRQKAIKRGN